jgi:glycosyltransferase involved in cell wall biosynthesis
VGNCVEENINNVHIVSANFIANSRFSRFLKTSKAVYKKALALDAAIYHIHDPELLPFALKLKRKGKIVIYDVHEDVPKTILAKFWINKFLRKSIAGLFETYENYVAKKMDYIITATPHIRNRFLKINPNTRDINNYPLLDELVEQTNWELKKNEVCYTGAITKIRGINEVMQCLSLIKSKCTFNLAGTFDQESLKEEILAHENSNKIKYFGQVNRKEIHEIMMDSKIGIVTFLPVPNHIDSQPNKMFEYMSAGIPVVGSNFELWRDILEKNNCGICINPSDSDAIANAINYLLENEKEAKEMGERGRKAVLNKYNWENEEKKLIAIYNKLLSNA